MLATLVFLAVVDAVPSALDVALQALTDALASGNVALAIVASVLALGVIVLKVLGKKIPFVDAAVTFVLDLAKKLSAKKPADQPGVADVVKAEMDKPAANDNKEGLGSVVDVKKD